MALGSEEGPTLPWKARLAGTLCAVPCRSVRGRGLQGRARARALGVQRGRHWCHQAVMPW